MGADTVRARRHGRDNEDEESPSGKRVVLQRTARAHKGTQLRGLS